MQLSNRRTVHARQLLVPQRYSVVVWPTYVDENRTSYQNVKVVSPITLEP